MGVLLLFLEGKLRVLVGGVVLPRLVGLGWVGFGLVGWLVFPLLFYWGTVPKGKYS